MNIFEIASGLGLEVTENLGVFGHSEIARTKQGIMIKSLESRTLDKLNGAARKKMARHIAETTTAYYQALKKAGVAVPPVYDVKHLSDEKTTRVVAVTTDMGPDCKTLMLECLNDDRVWRYVAKILRSIETVAHRDDLGIDPHPPNYAGEDVTYVDFFQVQMTWKGKQLVGFPTPEDSAIRDYIWQRYTTLEGTMRILRFNVLRLNPGRPEWEGAFYKAVEDNLPMNLADRAFNLFATLPERRAQELIRRGQWEEMKQLIDGLDMFQTDDLREIALRLAPDSVILDQLFPLSRLDFREPTSILQIRLEQFKKRLYQLVDGRAL